MPAKRSVSFVIPCLNEEKTLPAVLETIRKVCEGPFADRVTEILVSDNGSTDGSVDIAIAHGARVTRCEVRGYGAALKHGIANASHELVVFADADTTYDFGETPRLLEQMTDGVDMVIGSRLSGDIRPGAMSFLHRRVGTPVLNCIINLLYAHGDTRVTDCNSGFRLFKRERFLDWNVESDGMEFASEMLVKALRAQARIVQIPITLYAGPPDRTPHLKTWRDGSRHLLQILLESPELFHHSGLLALALGWALLLASWRFGPVTLGFGSVLGIHTMLFAHLGTIFGITLWGLGLMLSARSGQGPPAYLRLATVDEGRLFWWSVGLTVLCMAPFALILSTWAAQNYTFLALERETLLLTGLGSNGLLIGLNIFAAHLVKRT